MSAVPVQSPAKDPKAVKRMQAVLRLAQSVTRLIEARKGEPANGRGEKAEAKSQDHE